MVGLGIVGMVFGQLDFHRGVVVVFQHQNGDQNSAGFGAGSDDFDTPLPPNSNPTRLHFDHLDDDENDAITNASGLSLMQHGDGTATILFALDDPSDPDMVDLDGDGTDDVQSLHDIYTTEVTLGQNNILGIYEFSGTPGTPPVRGTPFPSQLVNFGKTGMLFQFFLVDRQHLRLKI